MRQILTAISFLLVILVPTFLAARVSGVTIERRKKHVVPKKPPRRVDGAMTLFGEDEKASALYSDYEDKKRA